MEYSIGDRLKNNVSGWEAEIISIFEGPVCDGGPTMLGLRKDDGSITYMNVRNAPYYMTPS